MMKTCPKCNAQLPDEARFCVKCGCDLQQYAAQVRYCTHCGAKLGAEDLFCAACGTRVSGRTAPQPSVESAPEPSVESVPAQPTVSTNSKPRRNGRVVMFGMWPQSEKEKGVTVGGMPDRNGYFTGSDGAKYAFIDERYFKVEPIEWWVLREEEGTALLLADKVLIGRRFDSHSRKYEESEIREWLNTEFYNTAFDSEAQSYIVVSTIGTSVKTADLRDRIFLPHPDADGLFKKDSGLVTRTTDKKIKEVTPYARATGANPYGENWPNWESGPCFWWLRKSYRSSEFPNCAYAINKEGYGYSSYPLDLVCGGVVPALRIRLD